MLQLLTVCLRLAKEDGARSGVVWRVRLQGQVWENTECESMWTRQGRHWVVFSNYFLRKTPKHQNKDKWDNTVSVSTVMLLCTSTKIINYTVFESVSISTHLLKQQNKLRNSTAISMNQSVSPNPAENTLYTTCQGDWVMADTFVKPGLQEELLGGLWPLLGQQLVSVL